MAASAMAASIVFNPVICGLLVLLRTVESASDPLRKQQCSLICRFEIETIETYCFHECYADSLDAKPATGKCPALPAGPLHRLIAAPMNSVAGPGLFADAAMYTFRHNSRLAPSFFAKVAGLSIGHDGHFSATARRAPATRIAPRSNGRGSWSPTTRSSSGAVRASVPGWSPGQHNN